MNLPRKIVWYGEPGKPWIRIEETYEFREKTIAVTRKILLRTGIEKIVLSINVAASPPDGKKE